MLNVLSSVLSKVFYSLMVIFVAGPAIAQQAAPAQPPALSGLVPILMMLPILYFFVFRPQVKKQKLQQEFLSKVKRGDEVLTSGGILGRIEGLTDLYATLEIAPGVRIKMLRSQIAPLIPSATGGEVKA